MKIFSLCGQRQQKMHTRGGLRAPGHFYWMKRKIALRGDGAEYQSLPLKFCEEPHEVL